ncbi:MAG: SPFH domain-containing protein [Candidatus Pacearchaeota archaeon]|jgi:regulator of protease activity HflC (stomatin/prohibitin superfamily)
MEPFTLFLLFLGIFILSILIFSIRIINEYERGVKFTLGKYTGIMTPGINLVIPLIQTYMRVDMRQTTIELPPQEVITKDQVSLKIDGVVFYKVRVPQNVILNVEDLKSQIEAKASSELKEIIGNKTMKESLSDREDIAKKLLNMLNEAIEDKNSKDKKDWGIEIKSIQINNIELPRELIRAMSKQAEAEREKEARITKADGEFQASKKFYEASLSYNNNPSALRLRELQTYQEIGTEHNTLMMVIPSTMTNANGTWVLPMGHQELNKNLKERKSK